MKARHVVLLAVVLIVGSLVAFLAPVFNQPREKSAVADLSPEFLAKREAMREYLEQGRELLAVGKGSEAEAAFRKAEDAIPRSRNLDAEAGLAEALFLQGRVQEAVETYRRLVAECPGGVPLLLKYGKMCDRAGLGAEALAAYRQAFAAQGKDSGFPVALSDNASDAEVRAKAVVALRTYQQGQPDWQVEAERKMRESGEIRGSAEEETP